MHWHSSKVENVLKELDTTENHGLSLKEISGRVEKYGFNELKREKRIYPLKIFIDQFKDFLVLILIIAAIVSYISGFFGEGSSNIETFLIIAILIANGVFGFIQDYKAEKSIEHLKKMAKTSAMVLRNGRKEKIDSKDVVPGDILILQEGDIIPADARIIESFDLMVDESSLTGESVPVHKAIEVLDGKTVLADRKNMIYLSTLVVRGSGKAVVVSTGMSTEVGKIARKIEEAEERETPFQIELNGLGKKIGIGVLIIAGVIIATQLILEGISLANFIHVFIIGVALAVAAVPEGLPAVVTVSLALGSKRMVKKRALVRNLSVVESLGSVDVICTDKTGTLTEGRMTVRRIFFNGKIIDVSGVGYDLNGHFTINGKDLNLREIELILKTGFLCNNAEIRSVKDFFGDPTEIALLVSAMKGGITKEILRQYKKTFEIPFSSERKMMSVVYKKDNKEILFAKGAPEIILEKCSSVYLNGRIVKLSEKLRKEILNINEKFAGNALRVLGFAYKEGNRKEDNLTFLGLQGMIDPPRKEVFQAIRDCGSAGIRVVMITGDHKLTAQAIANELGFKSTKSLTGEEMDEMSDREFMNAIKEVNIYARVSPEHKVKILRALQKDHIVAMTGDGVNDAPALKQADVGISMGFRGTDVAKQSSGMILLDDNFTTIKSAIKEGRGIFDNIRKFVNYLLSANTGEVLVVFLAAIYGKIFLPGSELVVPLLATHLLWMNLLTDGLPALALGADPTSEKVMRRKPRKKNEGVINKRMIFSILSIGTALGLVTLVLFIINVSNISRAQTIVFTSLVVFELVRIQNVRSRYKLSLFSNKWLILAITASLLLQLLVIYTPLSEYFQVVALTLFDWLQIFVALIVFAVISKLISIFEDKIYKEESL